MQVIPAGSSRYVLSAKDLKPKRESDLKRIRHRFNKKVLLIFMMGFSAFFNKSGGISCAGEAIGKTIEMISERTAKGNK
jgi:hypothetical protein